MMSRAGVALLAVVACCVTTAASAQNNADELGNINAANGIEDNSNEVLDNEELNSNSNNMNSSNLGNNSNTGLNSNGGGNVSNLNNSMGANSNLGNNTGSNNGLGNNAGANGIGNPNNSLPLNNGGNGNVGLNNGGGRNNFSTPSLPGVPNAPGNVTSKNTGAATPLPLTNGGNKASNGTTATPPPNAALPPDAAQPPGEDDAPTLPPSPDGTAGAAPEEQTDTPAAESERPKKLSRAERRQQKLDVARKLAEAIPALRPGEGPPEYVVQPGDTLWDISDQLLDDPMWWPRLWVLNPEVTDPDKLEPGIKLLFYPSDAGKAPELVIKEQINPFGEPRINPATLQTFSLKAERWTGKNGEIMELSSIPGDQNLLTSGEQGATATYLFQLPGFMTNMEIDSVGEILSTPNSPLIAGQGQRIIASFNGRSPSPGERFVAVRHSTVLKEMDSKYSTMDLYNYTGILGVARAGADGNAVLVAEDPNSFVSPNDLLLPMNKSLLVAVEPGAPGRPNNAPAFVLASEQGNAIHAGPGMAVFLQGTNSNNPFAVGDDVELFMPLAGTFGYSDEFMDRESVAVARIVDANSDSAVGVIIRASREVSSGASTRPDLVP